MICSWNRAQRAREREFSVLSAAGRGAVPERAKLPTAFVRFAPVRSRALCGSREGWGCVGRVNHVGNVGKMRVDFTTY